MENLAKDIDETTVFKSENDYVNKEEFESDTRIRKQVHGILGHLAWVENGTPMFPPYWQVSPQPFQQLTLSL